jgi:hypothetical protein
MRNRKDEYNVWQKAWINSFNINIEFKHFLFIEKSTSGEVSSILHLANNLKIINQSMIRG